jgi:hypothetical protein
VLYGQFSIEADKLFFKKMLEDAATFPEDLRVEAVDKVIDRKQTEASINDYIYKSFSKNKLSDQVILWDYLKNHTRNLKDLIIQ